MAVQDITAYAHLSDDDVRDIGRRLSAIEKAHRESLGGKDADYIKSLIRTQRALDLIARIATATSSTVAVPAGMMLGLAKILENLEIGHNVMHGQWDWMNDPEIHSSTWEWDNTGPSSGWKHSHNVVHHTYTNIIGMDNDVGYGILRVTRDHKWTPQALMQPLVNVVLASLFQLAVGFYDVELGRYFTGSQSWEETKAPPARRSRENRTAVRQGLHRLSGDRRCHGLPLPGDEERPETLPRRRCEASGRRRAEDRPDGEPHPQCVGLRRDLLWPLPR